MIALLLVRAAAADAPSCEGCHAQTHLAWASSRHATAYSNPTFQAAWSRWRDPWCTGCHRPEGGVGCTSCHLVDGKVASTSPLSARAESAHPGIVVPALGTTACVGCHQFPAPDGGGPMQTTGAEHAAWREEGGGRSCASCHGGGHAVPSSRDPARLRAALSVIVARGADGVQATITATGIGHRFPTGDPWRRLVFELLRGEEVVARWTLSRRVAGVGAGFHEAGDTRLPSPGPDDLASRVIRAGPADDAERWRLTYLLVDPSHAELAAGEQGFVVAEGEVR